MNLPDLPFGGAVTVRSFTTKRLNDDVETDATGTSVADEEMYPEDSDLPMTTQYCNVSDEDNSSKKGTITRSQSQNQEYPQGNGKIKAYFTTMSTNSEINHHEYLMFAHENKEQVKKDESKQEADMALTDFLPEPRSLSHVIRQSESIRNKWGTAIQKELRGLFSSGTFNLDIRPLPNDEVVPVKLTLKTKLNARGQLDKLKARICLRGDMQEKGNINTWSPTSPARLLKRFLADAIHKAKKVYQLDFIQAFIQSDTTRRIFVTLDKEYKMFCPEMEPHLGRPLKLEKCLYGANFSGKSWYDTLDEFLVKDLQFIRSMVEGCLYIL